MIRFIQQVAAKYEVAVGTFGHMGDGNLHPTFLWNVLADLPDLRRNETGAQQS